MAEVATFLHRQPRSRMPHALKALLRPASAARRHYTGADFWPLRTLSRSHAAAVGEVRDDVATSAILCHYSLVLVELPQSRAGIFESQAPLRLQIGLAARLLFRTHQSWGGLTDSPNISQGFPAPRRTCCSSRETLDVWTDRTPRCAPPGLGLDTQSDDCKVTHEPTP